jgi:hypothetical protein
MKVEIKIYNEEHPSYLKSIKKYNKDIVKYEKYRNTIDNEDNLLFKLRNENDEVEMPIFPEPPISFTVGNIKDELIQGYYLRKDYDEIIVYLNSQLIADSSLIIKYDDKIIEQLDKILK